jgi:hypothetical protein
MQLAAQVVAIIQVPAAVQVGIPRPTADLDKIVQHQTTQGTNALQEQLVEQVEPVEQPHQDQQILITVALAEMVLLTDHAY